MDWLDRCHRIGALRHRRHIEIRRALAVLRRTHGRSVHDRGIPEARHVWWRDDWRDVQRLLQFCSRKILLSGTAGVRPLNKRSTNPAPRNNPDI